MSRQTVPVKLLIEVLRDPKCYAHPVTSPKIVETHASWVLLTGEHAYKIKKPVDLGFLDYSTLEKRRLACEKELQLNRSLAPELYVDVVPITGSIDSPMVNGDGPAFEYAVHMHQFDQACQFDHLLENGKLDRQDMSETAAYIAAFHLAAPVIVPQSSYGHAEDVHVAMRDNFTVILPLLSGQQLIEIKSLQDWTERKFESLRDNMKLRRQDGYVRECHGDLHLANLAKFRGEMLAFDRIEFNESFRWLDVMNDVAFLFMDLLYRKREDLAFQFLNDYLQNTGDYPGLTLLRYFTVYRALVRAKVALLRKSQIEDGEKRNAAQRDADRHLELAVSFQHADRPGLVIMHGFSGSGKTWLSSQLMTSLPAIRLRSDVERKRLFDVDTMARTGSGVGENIYTKIATRRAYEKLMQLAEVVIGADYPVIVDAAFLKRWQRELFTRLAVKRCIPWAIVECRAPTETLEKRLKERAGGKADASEADATVLRFQMESAQILDDEESKRVLTVAANDTVDWAAVTDGLRKLLAT